MDVRLEGKSLGVRCHPLHLWCIAIISFSCFIVNVGADCQLPDCFIDQDGNLTSCTECPVGYGVKVENGELLECRSGANARNTECVPCLSGTNYSDVNDSENKCKSCLRCHSDKEEYVRNCTVSQDAECQCKSGAYYKSATADACLPCRTCDLDNEEEVTACTPLSDRTCGPKTVPITGSPSPNVTADVTPSGTTQQVPHIATTPKTGETSNTPKDSLPVWAIIVIVIALCAVIGICAYFIYCICCKQDEQQSSGCCPLVIQNCICCGTQNNSHAPRSGQYAHSGGTTQFHPVTNGHCRNGTGNGNVRALQVEHEMQRSEQAPLLAFSISVPDRLIKLLEEEDPDGRNAYLFVEKLENPQEARDAIRKKEGSPGKVLIEQWEREGRTLDEFIDMLREHGRDDIADDFTALHSTDNGNGSSYS